MNQKMAEDARAEGMKSLKKTQVKESEAEAKLGSGNSDSWVNLGMWIMQDLLLAPLGVHKEMAILLALMHQMLQVSMMQLEVSCISSMDLGAQAEVICNIGWGTSVVRACGARLKSAHAREPEHRGRALEELEKYQGPSGTGEKLESDPIEGLIAELDDTLR